MHYFALVKHGSFRELVTSRSQELVTYEVNSKPQELKNGRASLRSNQLNRFGYAYSKLRSRWSRALMIGCVALGCFMGAPVWGGQCTNIQNISFSCGCLSGRDFIGVGSWNSDKTLHTSIQWGASICADQFDTVCGLPPSDFPVLINDEWLYVKNETTDLAQYFKCEIRVGQNNFVSEGHTPLNRPPSISSPNFSFVHENVLVAHTISASDPDPEDSLTFSIIGGVDQSLFNITPDGVLTFTTPPDFENPRDAGGDNIYNVEVTVDDGREGTVSQAISITVTNVNEPPVITSSATVSMSENTTAVQALVASDPDGEGALTFSLGVGLDAMLFSLTPAGILRFLTSPDFENPGDAGADNSYQVEVIVQDSGGLASSQVISITIQDVPEPLTISGRPSTDVVFNTPYTFTPTAFDSDGTEIVFAVEHRPSWAIFNTATGTLSGTPALGDAGIYDDIVISAMSGGEAVSLPAFRIVVAGINQPPHFNVVGDNPVKVCTNAGGQIIPFITDISDGDFETQQLEAIVENTNPGLFGGLLGFGGQPNISAGLGDLYFRGKLNQSGGADVTVRLRDDGGTANGGRDTSDTFHFSVAIDPTCDDGAGELFNAGQFDLDPITTSNGDQSGLADLTIGLTEGRFNTVIETLGDLGSLPLDAVTGMSNTDESTSVETTPFTATISNRSEEPGRQVTLRVVLGSNQAFLESDPRCEIDAVGGQVNCYLKSIPQGVTKLGFEAKVLNGEVVNATAEIHAANDQEFRDNRAQLRPAVRTADGETDDSAVSNGGGSMHWLGLLMLYGLRRKMH